MAAREVQTTRFIEMNDADFELSDDDQHPQAAHSKETGWVEKMRDIASLGPKERRKLLKLQHPELLPVVSHFATFSKEYIRSTTVATKTLLENDEAAKVRVLDVSTSKHLMIGPGIVRLVGQSCLGRKMNAKVKPGQE